MPRPSAPKKTARRSAKKAKNAPSRRPKEKPQNRDETGRFKPGCSGNPGGRPAGFAKLIQEKTRDGVTLVEFMLRVFGGKVKASLAQRMEAATWLADRGFGRPKQAVEHSMDDADALRLTIITKKGAGGGSDAGAP